jgi:hypothetical protein
MATFGNNLGAKKGKKTTKIYLCEICDYKCCKKYALDRHLATRKHIEMTNGNTLATEKGQKGQLFICTHCGKEYSDRTGLWKHKSKCEANTTNELTKPSANEEEKQQHQQQLIEYLLKENSEFKQLMLEQNKSIIELAKNAGQNNVSNHINSHNTTSNVVNNNSFNLQFYLNETCKDAMDIMDFVNQLHVGISDLEETGRLGFAEGISKIFIKRLKQINIDDRPIHCSDVKRETIYIKSNNVWNKETNDKTILTNALKHVAYKNMKQIGEWIKEHPDYNDPDSKENDRYLQIVSEAMSGSTKEETNKNYNKIIRNIAKETVIEK